MKALRKYHPLKILPGTLAVVILTMLLAACDSSNDSTPAAIPTIDSNAPKVPHFSEMLNYLPDNGPFRNLTYNNFSSIFRMYGITQESYTKNDTDPLIKIKNGYSPTLLQSAFSNLLASGASSFTAKDDQVKAFGWSRFQVAAEIYNDPMAVSRQGIVMAQPQPVNILQGQFDLKAIDTALLAKGYQKEMVGTHTLYSTGKDGQYNPQTSLFEFRIGLNNIAVAADGSAILLSAYKASLVETLQLAGPTKSLGQNQPVKALASVLDQAQMVNIFNIKAFPDINNLGTYDFRNLTNKPEKQAKALKLAKELPKFPAAKMGAIAYYEPNRGERYYLLAAYYDTAYNAGLARPALERLIKEGYPFNTGAFYGGQDYNSYMTLVESSQHENVVLFKLKMSNDTIIFAPSQLDYPLGFYKE